MLFGGALLISTIWLEFLGPGSDDVALVVVLLLLPVLVDELD
jgi:hypothetical protein